jgi:CheY-like chemotaxis protein
VKEFDPAIFERGFGRGFIRFQELMRHRVHEILLVSSVYDSFILEEDGQLEEGLIHEYMGLNLGHLPRMTRASGGRKALDLVDEMHFDLIITTMNLGDMDARIFARRVRESGIEAPVVLLSYDSTEIEKLSAQHGLADFEKVFLWQGDFRILLAIVKYIEDRLNVEEDTKALGVQSVIVLEDNVRYYSSFMPLIYAEVVRQTQNVLSDGFNYAHRIMRLRARPKILLFDEFEEASEAFLAYHDNVLGVISDIAFSHKGKHDKRAGVTFARQVREMHPDIPILLQSSDVSNRSDAEALGVSFVQKESPLLLEEVRRFMIEHMSFGDFVFRTEDGEEVARAHDLRSLEEVVKTVPEEALFYHAERNHFSSWLKARTEFWLAHRLRPRKVSDYETADDLRRDIVESLRDFRHAQQRGMILDFDPDTFDPAGSFARIGGGSLGGKGRGLAFVSRLLEAYEVTDRFEGVRVVVPSCVVLGTDVFDEFLEANDLLDFAVQCDCEDDIRERFLAARLPGREVMALRAFLHLIRDPLAVRSSSLLEDSKHQPFAGIYGTHMLPNDHDDPEERLEELFRAVKLVYASTFSKRAKAYMRATSYRIEEEKMAVVVQRLAGVKRGDRYYPDFSGVGRSHNFYPSEPMKSEDGIASVALGLGIFVVEGGPSLRFCPKYPKHVQQLGTVEDALAFSQREFCALELCDGGGESAVRKFDLEAAEKDGALFPLASVYSAENDRIYDSLSRPGPRILTFAPILKHGVFPLPEILTHLLELGSWSMSSPVEIEFAVTYAVPPGAPKVFNVLQMRPMVIEHEPEEVQAGDVDRETVLCESRQVLGNGILNDLRDIVTVDLTRFERSWTRAVAREIGQFNHELVSEGRPYVLLGVGRWGSSDPWLGIPVTWEEIAGARVIVEASFQDMRVTPSQGSHFFQNLATMQVGYFTADGTSKTGFVDWDWVAAQPEASRRTFTRRLTFDSPLIVKMDGRTNHGIIVKPHSDPATEATS